MRKRTYTNIHEKSHTPNKNPQCELNNKPMEYAKKKYNYFSVNFYILWKEKPSKREREQNLCIWWSILSDLSEEYENIGQNVWKYKNNHVECEWVRKFKCYLLLLVIFFFGATSSSSLAYFDHFDMQQMLFSWRSNRPKRNVK